MKPIQAIQRTSLVIDFASDAELREVIDSIREYKQKHGHLIKDVYIEQKFEEV